MKKPDPKPTDAPALPVKKNPSRGSLIATGVMFLIVVLLWMDLSGTKKLQQELVARNEQLSKDFSAVQSELKATNNELDFFKTGDFSKSAKEQTSAVKPVKAEPVEEPETLILQEPTVQQTASGLVARFEFKPDDSDLPESITLVVRVPGDSESKILSLKPVAKASYASVECVVDAMGKLGMIEGSPSDLSALSFELAVSAPVKAIVRGSKGIKAFELDISAEGCSVRKL